MRHILARNGRAAGLVLVLISVVLVGAQASGESTSTTGQAKRDKADAVYYVNASSTASSADGSSWAKAYKTLQHAVDHASSEGGGEIWVAGGTYRSTRSRVLTMEEGVALYGGFAGDEDSRGNRNPGKNISIIDGEYTRRCVIGADNSVLDGFTITRGFDPDDDGGGGMLNDNVSPSIIGCTFTDNLSNRAGGAILNEYGSNPLISHCLFINNISSFGGALCNMEDSSALIRSCRFIDNWAEYAGAIFNNDATVTIKNSQFFKNTSLEFGGALYNNESSVTIDDCIFWENYSDVGGAIVNSFFDSPISNTLFYKNTAEDAAVIFNSDSSPTLTNCVLWENNAPTGGSIYNTKSSNPVLMNCTIANNQSEDIGGIINSESSPKIVNSIIWGNSDEQISNWDAESDPEVSYSCIQGGYPGVGNIDEDPRFVNAPYSLQLLPNSPCIDTGTSVLAPNRDVLNRARPAASEIDMGAYEGAVPASERYTLTLETTPDGLGKTIPPAGSYEYAKGDRAILRAVPYGAAFKEWTGDYPGTNQILIGVMNSNKTLTAVFESNLLYVDSTSTAVNADGQSWATAFKDIQSAIDASSERGGAEIWVAQGTYTSTEDQVVSLREGVTLYGGFAGNEILREERDWNAHPTIIDGEDLRRCVLGADYALLDGFIITRGAVPQGAGAGIFNYRVSPTVANCIFKDNTADLGAAMTNWHSEATVYNCIFTGNTADVGAAMINYASETTVYNCIFTGNSADSVGGALYDIVSESRYINCTFFGNNAIIGGAISSESTSSRIINSIVWGNFPTQIEGVLDVSYSCIQDGYEGIGNIEENPLFLHAPSDLRLHLESPCIDAGTVAGAPPKDLLNQPRPQGGKVDMGVYEKTPVPLENQYTLTIEMTPAGLGDSFPPPGTYYCAPGDVVGIEAISHGTGFLYWRGDVDSDNKDIALVMDGHKTVTAHFEHTIHFADASSTAESPDGLSWATAFPNIQSAVDAAAAQGGGEVWVAEGTYTYPGYPLVVEMEEGVMLYGGFSGQESSREERDWRAYPTIIDGEEQRTGVLGADHAVLDGFTITRGLARHGGGMLNYLTSPTVSNCIFIENEAFDGSNGGAMCNMVASPVVNHCQFIENKAEGFGGALYNFYLPVSISDCSFTDNEAYAGGAISNTSAPVVVTGCAFNGNSSQVNGAAIFNNESDGMVSHSTFTDNTAASFGGAVGNDGSSPLITNCTFSENSGRQGGGAVVNYNVSSPHIINSVFVNNSTEDEGRGGAISNYSSAPEIINCSITENTAHIGGGIYNVNASSPKILNSIVWANTPEEIVNFDAASLAVVSYSCIDGGYAGTGNIDADPLFVLAPENLQLSEGSPCIDTGGAAGAPTHDLLDRSRPRGAGFDMGAYEFIPAGEEEFPEGEDAPIEGEELVPPIEGEPPVVAEGEDVEPDEGETTEPDEGEDTQADEGETDEGEGETLVPDEGEGEGSTPVEGEDNTKPDDDEPKGCNCGKSKQLFEEGFSLELIKKNLSDWLLTGLSVMILLSFSVVRRS